MELTANYIHDELVEQCKRGHVPGFQALYNKYSKAMYNTSLRIVNNSDDAEDVLQEAFTDAFRSLNDFNYRSTFGSWLKRIVINKSINVLRKRKMDLVDIDHPEINIKPEDDGIDEQEIQFKVNAIKDSIRQLPDGYRAVITLYLLEGYDHEEISEILGITHNTVRTQYVRAKQKLLFLLKQGGLS
ncbi:MAG: sigma-70 family RNA polymerase sigma factor [Chitinophagaceae bacterium]|nr:MAG: sigma-70 family RNA polymerase sigma factor [Chitinophagaceae bacterium]